MKKSLPVGAVILLGSTIVAGCGRGVTVTATPAGGNPPLTQTPLVASLPRLQRIHMMSLQSGWAQSSTYLYHTQDGGKSWTRVQVLPLPSQRLMPAQWAFVDPTQAVMVYSRPNGTIVQKETFNSGRSWIRRTIASPFGHFGGSPVPTQITFLTPQHGWLLLAPIQGMNSATGALLNTTNGGASWTVEVKNPTTNSSPPLGRAAVQFSSLTEGWLVASATSTTPATLYRTTDAGVQWQSEASWIRPDQNSPLIPPIQQRSQVLLPSILTSRVGIVKGMTLWRSDTAGATWTRTPNLQPVLPAVLNNEDHWVHPDFVSLTTGWAAGPHGLLYTTDGGRNWAVQNVNPKGITLPTSARIQMIQFFSTRIGTVFVATPHFRQEWLLITKNGGQQWGIVFKKL